MIEELKPETLNGKTVEYELPFDGYRERAIGVFEVSGNVEHRTLSLTITRSYRKTELEDTFVAVRIPVLQSAIPAIQLHPNQEVARFSLTL